ncbi:Nif3-like dinuclear metal center hexameric protein [Telluribacter sp.]|jgi:putative NIF3 family GTP cyclohydrolase 1 type 2|uniref:Nif3-like dinuclear metal center hexameric protein n=1 Tax=Telluribacter sp. TaxID=1978767 RepID=UPI002E1410D7|nr:Nif3-like dinuclear metal center hexameric protein [Telluribacter sp.]
MPLFPQNRRTFIKSSLGLAAATIAWPDTNEVLTAGQVIDRIKANVGIPWREQTVDNLIVGTRDQEVKGIATVMMATLEVLQQAAAKGLNLIVTHEPTYYSHQDKIEPVQQDSLFQQKRDFLEKNGMAVFHFHDHWHGRKPDGIATGMIRELGWEKYSDPEQLRLFHFENMTLAQLAQSVEKKLGIRTMRVLGDPNLPVKRLMASWGNVSLFPGVPFLAQADALIIGETNEWELVEYVQDAIASGQKKGLIIMGHVVSEQAGMKYAADWLRGFIKEVPVEYIAIREPFWRPGQPVK